LIDEQLPFSQKGLFHWFGVS